MELIVEKSGLILPIETITQAISLLLKNQNLRKDTLKNLNLPDNFTQICYDLLNPRDSVCDCGKRLPFQSFAKGYYRILGKYCRECYKSSSELKELHEKQGRARKGNLNAWTDIARAKRISTNIEKYKSENVMSSDHVKDRVRASLIERYGTTSPFIATDKGREAWKLGIEASSSEASKLKKEVTNLHKYGVSTPLLLERTKASLNLRRRALLKERIDKASPNLELIGELNRHDEQSSWRCTKCGLLFDASVDNGSSPICYKCEGKPSHQKDVYEFIKSLDSQLEVVINSRTIIRPLELDIFIPSKKIAIEYNGVFWHSNKEKDYHLKKTLQCLEHDIQLIHVFEDEWITKNQIWKSMIAAKLGYFKRKLNGRSCSVEMISRTEGKNFLDEYHLRGNVPAKYYLGLKFQDELVGVCSLGVPRFDKTHDLEILRVCFKSYTQIRGGVSKLINFAIHTLKPASLMTYVDRTLGEGEGYLSAGFVKVRETPPGYFYVKNYSRWHRSSFQKHKLKKVLQKFDDALTEAENMKMNGYLKIYDCGNNVLVIANAC